MSEEKNQRAENGQFLKGNRIWEARSSAGPKPKFDNPDALWKACVEYFEWVEANPLKEDKLFSYQGSVHRDTIHKMRAMTLDGLYNFLDIHHDTWADWRKNRPDLSEVITKVESVIKQQKFEGAAADLLNPNIIARDLGLADKVASQQLGKDGKPTDPVDAGQIADKVAAALSKTQTASCNREKTVPDNTGIQQPESE